MTAGLKVPTSQASPWQSHVCSPAQPAHQGCVLLRSPKPQISGHMVISSSGFSSKALLCAAPTRQRGSHAPQRCSPTWFYNYPPLWVYRKPGSEPPLDTTPPSHEHHQVCELLHGRVGPPLCSGDWVGCLTPSTSPNPTLTSHSGPPELDTCPVCFPTSWAWTGEGQDWRLSVDLSPS